jgi:hypothetical protein
MVFLSLGPWDAWRSLRFTAQEIPVASVASDAADPDHDGLGNFGEHTLRSDPRAPSAALVKASSAPKAPDYNRDPTLKWTLA